MKKILFTLCILLVIFIPEILSALPAFPGAEGFGSETMGGRGGKVYVVTNLNSTGPGSFTEAWYAQEPRIIVFRVSGVIDIPNNRNYPGVDSTNSFVTIAGQTSPGGITIISTEPSSSIIKSYHRYLHDFVFRFMRFRGGAHTEDALQLNMTNTFVIDHCDVSGARDETVDMMHSYNYTIQWSTISNSSEGQTYGILVGSKTGTGMTMHHNLLAHHVHRFPSVGCCYDSILTSILDYRNNLCYNSETCQQLSVGTNGGMGKFDVVGNYFKYGPNTQESCSDYREGPVKLEAGIDAYLDDNYWIPKGLAPTTEVLANRANICSLVTESHDFPAVTMHTAQEAYDVVLDKVGAWPRDAMNTRTVEEVRNGTGQLRKDDDPLIQNGPEPPDDTDMDGMPDDWETRMGLDPNNYDDNTGDHDGDGYTNIEEYINDLALVLLGEEPHNSGIDMTPFHGKLPSQSTISAYPNPYSGNGDLQLRLMGKIKEGLIKVFDINGKIVRTFPASSSITWNGLSRNNKPLGSGIYVIRWECQGKRISQKSLFFVF
jgi:pectate lyase